MPHAFSTYDGSTEPDEHAEPDESAMSSIAIRIVSPATPAKCTLRLCGSRRSILPFKPTPGSAAVSRS